ncbi:HigA family addiction module antitoxin [Bradyrhizobium ontarionense]|uniref:HigA family addiction module antitoxin n=1 Tax=Bradyrhizobium ontarionense TaxID=2898149 RepID=A0ABY3R557_9BRAD|nr:HigA family addiction module antitoxin [Bradyrhizobium sp. A19]UFZ02144.1 HigA family addiction module antitoxin [Bradyrhizobium sp. A19]
MAYSTPPPVDHPGTFIEEELESRRWTQADLAYILSWDASQLNKLIKGGTSITPDTAVALGDAFAMPAEFFMNLQKMYDLQKARKADPGVKTRATWVSIFPVREMIKRGWLAETEADLLDLQMMRFFDANRIEDIPLIGCEAVAHAAKKTGYDEITGTQLVWLHRVRRIAAAATAPNYDRTKLVEALPDIRAHMLDSEDFGEIPNLLWHCGVRVVFVQQLPGSKIDGVCTWLDDQPVIGLSLRLDRPDNLCFVLRHEIEHVLQEDGKATIYSHVDVFDPDRDEAGLPDEERRADIAAAEFLIPQEKLTSFMLRKGKWISETDVLAFSARHNIHPSVVIGQIQNRRHRAGDTRAFAFLRRYLTKVHEHFMSWPLRDGWDTVAEIGL